MKFLSLISRIILGAVFIFSGFVKAVDPLGSDYKFSDYFTAFKMGFLSFLALPMALLLPAIELVLGIALILGYHRRIIYRIVFWFLAFFTLLTLILALFNPVTDCGCFGDAIILTNWETFLKNVVLMIFVIPLIFTWNNAGDDERRAVREWVVMAALLLVVSGFSLWNLAHLPVLDFRPYDTGTVIREEMEVPEGAAEDLYETDLIYRDRESGESATFTIENYPKDTTRWEFVSSQSRLISKGYEPPIHDFAIMDEDGWDVVDQILSDKGYTLLMMSHSLDGADDDALKRANDWSGLERLVDDFRFYAVTSSTSGEIDGQTSRLGLAYRFYAADEIMLKTVVRSNPGFVLIRNGAIVGKWGFRDFPALAKVDPGLPELLENAAMPLDEETQMLLESGAYEGFSFGVTEFDRLAPALLYQPAAKKQEDLILIAFGTGILVLLLMAHLVAPVRR